MSILNFFKREKHTDHNPRIYFTLTSRHFKIFFKNKLTLFFSLLVPFITLIIYVVFLRGLEISSMDSALRELMSGWEIHPKTYSHVHVLADAWMFAGIIGVSCISVSLNTCSIIITDREKGVNKDFISSPISRRSVNVSYLLFNAITSLLINAIVLAVAFIYLAAIGGVRMSVGSAFLLIPTLILSVISASLITCFVASFMTSGAMFNSLTAIISSATGFVIGAFMPASMMGGAKYITCFFPGTYSCSLFKSMFLKEYYDNFEQFIYEYQPEFAKAKPEQVKKIKDTLTNNFSTEVDFFGTKLSTGYSFLALIIFILIFAGLNYLLLDHNMRSTLYKRERIKKNKTK